MKRFVLTLACATLALSTIATPAWADSVARYECSVDGLASSEPIGDRERHALGQTPFVCFAVDGLLKGAVYTGFSLIEWDGAKGVFVSGGGVHRAPGGLAVSQIVEGTSAVLMQDGKPAGIQSSGKGMIRFASGTVAALAGKPISFVTRPTGPNRFVIEMND